ncbi:(2,3-dihydroxybenzoyl)adenylate synthase [Cytobacillus kochii]|uniref:(2,3-dihydroxybenzoyl)adenylate synthase n=1 Tax=Cytobacillus kochii TaxID=859143 RepID=UPI0027847A29|nr:(2,3-dihydroxybenzoyl)adenylate synthase [Cytobacillus kochii]MDQ0184265.1 2,3-dihydroxybenzoate-AMP ligase [Cytobacillus kochii]
MLQGYTPWPDELATKYRSNGCWTGETFGEVLERMATLTPTSIALIEGNRKVTYEELNDRANRLAHGFIHLGIKKQDRVVLQLTNTITFFEVCFALFRMGALPIFSLPLHRQTEITYFCEHTKAVAYVIPDVFDRHDYVKMAREVKGKVNTLQHIIVAGDEQEFLNVEALMSEESVNLPNISGSDLAFFQLSGGSTGLPKLIPRTHDEYLYSIRKSVEICELSERTKYLAVLPVAHNFTMSSPGVFGVLYAGGCIILSPDPSPDTAFSLIEKEKVNFTSLVPPLAIIWIEAKKSRGYDLTSLEVIQVGGSKCSAEVAKKVGPSFGCSLQQVFGMAEGLVNYTRLDDTDEKIVYTQGRPMSEFDEIRIVDEEDQSIAVGDTGHLQVRGPYTIIAYYNAETHNEKAFTHDGFYRTGDIVKQTEDGYLIVEGRDKDQINRGGEKIAAEEVENYLLSHEDVLDAAIVSMPDAFLGERSCAFIISQNEQLTGQALKSFLQLKGIAAFKIPDRFEFVHEFPQTPLGKVSKKSLREIIQEKLATKI